MFIVRGSEGDRYRKEGETQVMRERWTKTKKKRDKEPFFLTHTLSSCEAGRTCCSAKTKPAAVSESATPCEVSGEAEEVLAPGSRPLSVCSSAVNLQSGGIYLLHSDLIQEECELLDTAGAA